MIIHISVYISPQRQTYTAVFRLEERVGQTVLSGTSHGGWGEGGGCSTRVGNEGTPKQGPHPPAPALDHSLTRPPTHPLIHAKTRAPTHPLAHFPLSRARQPTASTSNITNDAGAQTQ